MSYRLVLKLLWGGCDMGNEAEKEAPASEPYDILADHLVEGLSSQVSALHAIVIGLETLVSEKVTSNDRLTESSIQMVQKIDFLRQSLKDVSAILKHIGPSLTWQDGQSVDTEQLLQLVDMQKSVHGLLQTEEDKRPPPVHDIWL